MFLPTYTESARAQNLRFSGSTAYAHLLTQMSFGPRLPGSPELLATAAYIRSNLTSYGWRLRSQDFTYQNQLLGRNITAHNLIATLPLTPNNARASRIVLGAHYDTRPLADAPNSDNKTVPVPGADDGASGVAALLELGRVFATNGWSGGLTMVFFDAEDSGLYSPPIGWIQGSQYYVQSLNGTERSLIQVALILDMMGYSNLVLKREGLSDFAISNAIWSLGRALGYSQFASGLGPTLLDDHKPFLDSRIRAVDIIDFDYPYWHTPDDTADKVSPASLEAVGRTVEAFILTGIIVNPILPGYFFILVGALVAASGATISLLLRARRSQTSLPRTRLRALRRIL